MSKGIAVLVVGAGNFGKNYPDIISRLNSQNWHNSIVDCGMPLIDTVVITRTDVDAAKDMAKQLTIKYSNDPTHNCRPSIEGECVGNLADLEGVIKKYDVRFTVIATKDPVLGNRVHEGQSMMALKYGSVLCEKPFTDATGNGGSIDAINRIIGLEQSVGMSGNRFGLQLPLVQMGMALMENEHVKKHLELLPEIKIHYSSPRSTPEGVVNDLLIHAWSLLPQEYEYSVEDHHISSDRRQVFEVKGSTINPERKISAQIILTPGGNFRGMSIGGYLYGLKSSPGGITEAINMTGISLDDAAEIDNDSITNYALESRCSPIRIENPLKENIIASLKGSPATDSYHALRSQIFLEQAFGYKGEIDKK